MTNGSEGTAGHSSPILSFVLPVYNEHESLTTLHGEAKLLSTELRQRMERELKLIQELAVTDLGGGD